MASATESGGIKPKDLESFHAHLQRSRRVLALCGAGLSASSGLPTFRGKGGLWRTHESTSLATPEAFEANPGLVWQFYNYRRHMALSVQPNPAHHALAELARKMPGFQCLTQNVDGLSQRVDHPPAQLQLLHGTLFELKCSDKGCDYHEENFTDPVVSALAVPTDGSDPSSSDARVRGRDLDISDEKVPLAPLKRSDLPLCPECKTGLLRPGVVWFGESLPDDVLDKVDRFLDHRNRYNDIDLIIVIGTSAKVYPAAGYIDKARDLGARVCVVNMDTNDAPRSGWKKGDWLFKGDAATIVPQLLEPVIGDVAARARA